MLKPSRFTRRRMQRTPRRRQNPRVTRARRRKKRRRTEEPVKTSCSTRAPLVAPCELPYLMPIDPKSIHSALPSSHSLHQHLYYLYPTPLHSMLLRFYSFRISFLTPAAVLLQLEDHGSVCEHPIDITSLRVNTARDFYDAGVNKGTLMLST